MSGGRSNNSYMNPYATTKMKKAPEAPRRFKSSYMFFSTAKHKEIRAELTEKGQGKLATTEVAKMVSKAWKDIAKQERVKWEELARQDKARYEMEKSMYTGPWKVPATRKRISKDPRAPKRPMSAFLAFSNSKRRYVKAQNRVGTSNAELSRILAQIWKNSSDDDKKFFVDEEYRLRQDYKLAMSAYTKQTDEEFKAKRLERENKVIAAIREAKTILPPSELSPLPLYIATTEEQDKQQLHHYHHHHQQQQSHGYDGGSGSGGPSSASLSLSKTKSQSQSQRKDGGRSTISSSLAAVSSSYTTQMASDIFTPPTSSPLLASSSSTSHQQHPYHPHYHHPAAAAAADNSTISSDPYGAASSSFYYPNYTTNSNPYGWYTYGGGGGGGDARPVYPNRDTTTAIADHPTYRGRSSSSSADEFVRSEGQILSASSYSNERGYDDTTTTAAGVTRYDTTHTTASASPSYPFAGYAPPLPPQPYYPPQSQDYSSRGISPYPTSTTDHNHPQPPPSSSSSSYYHAYDPSQA